jgi:hypothetical protein
METSPSITLSLPTRTQSSSALAVTRRPLNTSYTAGRPRLPLNFASGPNDHLCHPKAGLLALTTSHASWQSPQTSQHSYKPQSSTPKFAPNTHPLYFAINSLYYFLSQHRQPPYLQSRSSVSRHTQNHPRGTDFKTYGFQQHPFGLVSEASPSTTNTLVIIPTGGEDPQPKGPTATQQCTKCSLRLYSVHKPLA